VKKHHHVLNHSL